MNSPCIVNGGIRNQLLEGKNEEWSNFSPLQKKLKMEMEASVHFFPIINVQAVYKARWQQTYFPFNELKITAMGMSQHVEPLKQESCTYISNGLQ